MKDWARLELWRVRDLLYTQRQRELNVPVYHRGPRGTTFDCLAFINDLFYHGIFGTLILEKRARQRAPGDARYDIIDGVSRIDAIGSALGGRSLDGTTRGYLFDTRSASFLPEILPPAGPPTNPFVVEPALILDQGMGRAVHELQISFTGLGLGSQEEEIIIGNLEALFAFLELALPVYIVESSAFGFSIFETFVDKGLPLSSPCPFGNERCTCVYKPLRGLGARDLCVMPGIDGHPELIRGESIEPTLYSGILGRAEVECRVSLVPRNIVTTLALPYAELRGHVRRAVERSNIVLSSGVAGGARGHEPYISRSITAMPGLLGKVMDADGLYDTQALREIKNILDELVPLLNRLAKNIPTPPRDLPRLSVWHSGVFIDEAATVGPYRCLPGAFVVDELDEGDRKHVILHELAHAFLRSHKKSWLDCRWIEEGLAEWLSKGHPSAYNPNAIKNADVSQSCYYDYFGILRSQPVKDVVDLALRWMDACDPATQWCDLVEAFLGMGHP